MNRIFLILLLICASCTQSSKEENKEFEHITTAEKKFDLVFPEPLWDLILHSAPPTINITKSAYEIFDTLPINVQLIQTHAPIFNGKNYVFEFKDFGGEIDWNNYLNRSESGSFVLKFDFPKMEDGDMKVFFLSWTKEHSKDDEVFGNGCHTILDLSSYFKNTVFKKGLLLHTKDSRYFFATAGRFYFVLYSKDKIKISQVTFSDSELKNRLCEKPL